MIERRRAKIEEIREAVLKCRSTTRAVALEPSKDTYRVDDAALEQVWTLIAELERDVTELE